MQNILIIDDEPSIIDNISFALETEGFSTISCSTGGETGFMLLKQQILH